MGHRYILAVETSCDDTGIAISCNHRILSNITLSSQTKHKQYGGIVPEIAARSHADNLSICCEQAMQQAKIGWTQLTHIAYTDAPGLPGSLHTGKIFAKSLAQLLKLPIIPVNHIHGHIYSFMIDKNKVVTYPFMSIVLSGGHTCIYLVKNIDHLEILNETADDAIGETLDKVGRILGFNYPGGVSIDQAFNAQKAHLKLIHHFKPEEKFSFSGVKTHITNLANQSKMKHQKLDKISVASSLLQWVVDEVMIKLNYYLQKYPAVKFVTIGGGVSANRLLRNEIKQVSKPVFLPELKYANDNAAMIALYAYLTIQ